MSRSFTKNQIVKDYSKASTRFYKRQSSKKVRGYEKRISRGGQYKKIFESWKIFDYKQVYGYSG